MKRDQKNRFMFSPLQGEYVKKINSNIDINNLDTLYVYDGQKIFIKTEAVRLIGKNLGGVWKFLSMASKILPLTFCNWIYDLVAKNRNRIFGRSDSCRLPTPSEAEKFYP